MLRTSAEFSSSLPDDSFEDEHRCVLPGRNVAEALREMLAGLDCEVEPVEDAGDHGWAFHASRGDVRFYCELTVVFCVVAHFIDMSIRASSAEFAEVLTELSDVLQADARFHQLGWFTADEVWSERTGASSPTGVFSPEPCRRSIAPRVEHGEGPPPPAMERKVEAPPGLPAGWSDLRPHPHRRWLARAFDFYLVTAVVMAGLAHVIPGLRRDWPSPADIAPMWLLPVRVPVSVLVNALLLAGASTTPGKWLCGVKIVRADGRRPSFAQAIRREAAVIFVGCGFYLPLVSLIPMGMNWGRLLTQESASWDRERGLVAVQRPDSVFQQALTFVAFVGMAGFYLWLG